MAALRVMVVDDSVMSTKPLTFTLGKLGFDVVRVCSTGKEAVYAYSETRPDIVTMDITMPDMDGIEACRAILALDHKANIVMVTSHGQEAMVLEAIKAGAKGYVLKPVKMEALGEALFKVAVDLVPESR
jgi:two-component system chemotaxis response regulator CheY